MSTGTEQPVPSYDATAILARMRDDRESDWPDRLLEAIARVPLVEEAALGETRDAGPLSQGEQRALRLVSHGLRYEEVAEVLGLAEETVKTQLRAARRKLKAKNSCHAACEAIRLGLIP